MLRSLVPALMNDIDPVVTFRTGFAGSRRAICLSGAIDAFDAKEPYTRLIMYSENAPDLWVFNEHFRVFPSVCLWHDPATPGLRVFAALSEEGAVGLMFPEMIVEQIPDAGPRHESSKGYGYLNAMRQIGDHLYACGFAGQVYKRSGPDHWIHFDEGLLQEGVEAEGKYFIQAIDGPNEQSIYVAGSEYLAGSPGRADHWNGVGWTRLELPRATGRITNIFVESPERIWMCGSGGTLITGNARDGFTTVGQLGASTLFLSMTRFGDRYYLASNVGLFSMDPNEPEPTVREVRTGLQPELVDANVVQVADDVLWSMGPKDIARFDGTTWVRIPHPDNPPIA
ncbi:MAG: hypothetical protein JWP97_5924 [Labilithrix sp.]|nr:hypothetical protein [Labilithrix sp.]